MSAKLLFFFVNLSRNEQGTSLLLKGSSKGPKPTIKLTETAENKPSNHYRLHCEGYELSGQKCLIWMKHFCRELVSVLLSPRWQGPWCLLKPKASRRDILRMILYERRVCLSHGCFFPEKLAKQTISQNDWHHWPLWTLLDAFAMLQRVALAGCTPM